MHLTRVWLLLGISLLILEPLVWCNESSKSDSNAATSAAHTATQTVVAAPPAPPAGAAAPPPPGAPAVPPPINSAIPWLAGANAGLLPGLGLGTHFNLGAGLGSIGGYPAVGAPPPPPPSGGSPWGLMGSSYVPQTWLGSALGAKGDILFPLVIFIFFVVGVWTIVQFLLGLIVPLIASKLSILNKGGHKFSKFRRALSPEQEKEDQINQLTSVVWAAFESVGCMKTSACYLGNIMNSLVGPDKVKQYENVVDALKFMDKDIVAIFKKSAESGKENCSIYPCNATPSESSNSVHDKDSQSDIED